MMEALKNFMLRLAVVVEGLPDQRRQSLIAGFPPEAYAGFVKIACCRADKRSRRLN
jgi:hypothetical protein